MSVPINLSAAFADLMSVPLPAEKRGTHERVKKHASDNARKNEFQIAKRAAQLQDRLRRIAVLDFETDPFDNIEKDRIEPFAACLYSDEFDPVIIWNDNPETFIEEVIGAILALPEPYTIYAHNGGKFDYMFLIHRIRGQVQFKGRGLMTAKIGPHQLRDSFHILPEKLANMQKDEFDYSKLKRCNRKKWRAEIIKYMTNDCAYLLPFIKGLLEKFGFKLSIGQMAMTELKKTYEVAKLSAGVDMYLRKYFFGGRVDCLQGAGHWGKGFKLYDVNSMYPDAMAHNAHPIGDEYSVRRGRPGPNTVFLEIECENSNALIGYDGEGMSTRLRHGTFFTTIWEYETAIELDLIRRVRINNVVDCNARSDFSDFVYPLYNQRQEIKKTLAELKARGLDSGAAFNDVKRDDYFFKYILNNAYGKFAQNPRRFKESYFTDPKERPPEGEAWNKGDDFTWGLLPKFEHEKYWIWERPAPRQTYNNVGTAASITGAARAKLMRATFNAVDPIYCDTDSLICRELPNVELHPSNLGAWDLEATFDEVIIAGKKTYACKIAGLPDGHKGRIKVRSKGVAGLTWPDYLKLVQGENLTVTAKGPTLTKYGEQYYMERNIRSTAKTPQRNRLVHANHVPDLQRFSA